MPQVDSKSQCKKDHDEDEQVGKRQLWAWVSPDATARACLQVLEADFKGHEIFNIVSPLLESASKGLSVCRSLLTLHEMKTRRRLRRSTSLTYL